MNGNDTVTECLKEACSWNAKETVICDPGGGSCALGKVHIADPSEFHDGALISASNQIQGILDKIPKDPDGRELAFLNTTTGLLLAWVHHGEPVPDDAVTIEDDYETIAAALGLPAEEDPYQSTVD